MKRVLLKGGRVICPESGVDDTLDIVVMGGRIASIKKSAEAEGASKGGEWEVMDCTGLLVVPGLIDLHSHLREPGEEYKETISSGTASAAAGGFTAVLSMANTKPVNDNESVTRFILKKAAEEGVVKVLPVGAITRGLEGKCLTEMGELALAGCVAFSDDGVAISDGGIMRRALEYSQAFDRPIITHAEDVSIAAGGVVNEGRVSTALGLMGIPRQSEDAMVARDVSLAELTGGRLHVAHVSTRGAIEIIRAAKARGVRVSAEATPHHLTLDHEAVRGFDTDAKMNPPLREPEDVEALRAALKDGTIDCVATDHAPHSSVEKDIEFDSAANGVVGFETALGLVLGLVDEEVLSLSEAISRMSTDPARVMGIEGGALKVGAAADLTVIDLESKWTVDAGSFESKGRNTPFKGWKLKGRAVKTIVDGRVVYDYANKEGKRA